jgi:hypothetical protein
MKRTIEILLGAALLLALCMNGLLLRANHRLSTQIAALEHTDGPAIGQHISVLSGTTSDDRPINIPLSGRKTLIFLFTPTCPYCRLNWHNWETISSRSHSKTNLVWGDLSGTASADFLAQHEIHPEPGTFLRVGPQSRDVYAFHVTPTTILVEEDGTVKKVWLGLLDESKVREIESMTL